VALTAVSAMAVVQAALLWGWQVVRGLVGQGHVIVATRQDGRVRAELSAISDIVAFLRTDGFGWLASDRSARRGAAGAEGWFLFGCFDER